MSDEIERLKAAMYEANRVASEASDRARSAREAYKSAVLDANGLRGHLVEYRGHYGGTLRFVVDRHDSDFGTGYVAGPIVRKDGSLGNRVLNCGISVLKDLGPYEAPAGRR